MKKMFVIFLICSMLLSYGVYAENVNSVSYPIIVDGNQIDTSDTLIFSYNDRTYVPLRLISETTGAVVVWDEETQTIFIRSDSGNISTLNSALIYSQCSIMSARIQSLWRRLVCFSVISETAKLTDEQLSDVAHEINFINSGLESLKTILTPLEKFKDLEAFSDYFEYDSRLNGALTQAYNLYTVLAGYNEGKYTYSYYSTSFDSIAAAYSPYDMIKLSYDANMSLWCDFGILNPDVEKLITDYLNS